MDTLDSSKDFVQGLKDDLARGISFEEVAPFWITRAMNYAKEQCAQYCDLYQTVCQDQLQGAKGDRYLELIVRIDIAYKLGKQFREDFEDTFRNLPYRAR